MRHTLIRNWLKKKGEVIAPYEGPFFASALDRLRSRQLGLQTVIDVGASNGCWSEAVLPYFPMAQFLCVEAQRAHEPALRAFAAKHANVACAFLAAGNREGDIYFDNTDLFGGVASETPPAGKCVRVPVTTLDRLADQHQLKGPFLVKLDTHGFELPILAGATRILSQTVALIIEVYNLAVGAKAVRFAEMCRLLEDQGFRCADLFDVLYRPADRMLWQMDLVFLRSDRPEFARNGYQ